MGASTTADASTKSGKASAKTKPDSEQHRALLIHHMTRLRQKRAELEELKAPVRTAQDEFTVLINDAKNDLGKGYTRKYLVGLLEDATTRLRNLLQEEERRARDREALGLPVFGVQADLFGEASAKMPDEARDEVQYEAEGFMRGRNGALEAIPEGTPPRFHQAILRGYEKGQQLTQEDFLKGQELRQQQSQPDAAAAPQNLNDEDDEADLDEEARKLKRSGFMETGSAEQDHDNFEAPAEELAGQKPRRAVQESKAAEGAVAEPVH